MHPHLVSASMEAPMTTAQIPDNVRQQIANAASGPANAFLERIIERLRGAAAAEAVYGETVERDGVTIIPVAKVRWAFGGGNGTGEGPDGRGSGTGVGGAISSTPLGYIEIRNGEAEFKPIQDPANLLMVPPVIIAGGLSAVLIIGALRRLLRG